MQVITTSSLIKPVCKELSYKGNTIGFVPTMGALHSGHLSLIERSKKETDKTVVSVFVNPTQFNSKDDFSSYPQDFEKDLKLLRQFDVDVVFAPDQVQLYPDDYVYQVKENKVSHELEGEHRPGHFDGVLTVVLKLFNLVCPQKAYFGEKDFQQLYLIQKMVDAFFMDVEIVPCQTIRDEKGLALSSRNQRLSLEGIKKAQRLNQLLSSELDSKKVTESLVAEGFQVDYVCEKYNRRLAAVYLEGVRLIDNVTI